MRVLFMTNVPSPYRVDFFNELGRMCELTVLFETKTAKSRNAKWTTDQFRNFKAFFLKGKRIGEAEAFCPGVLRYLSKKKYDVIVVGFYSSPTGMLAIEYMRFKHIPFLLNSDGGLQKNDSGLRYKLKRHFIAQANGWLSTGKKTSEYFEYYGADARKITVYPFTSLNKKDLSYADELRTRGKQSIKEQLDMPEKTIILSVGRFSYEAGYGKGYDVLMNLAEMLLGENVGIYLVGDEPTKEFLDWKEDKKLLNVHFVGFKNKKELALYYAAADIFVLMTKYDVWGLVINEAMSYSLPIITTNKCVAGIELVKEDENGFLLDVGDLNTLYERVNVLTANPEKMKLFGEKSYEIISEFTVENMAKIHYETFKKFVF